VFLGLIADERGEAERASAYYASVARSSTALGASGRMLLEHSGPERWSVVAIFRPGYDSNVALQPATATAPGPGGNGDGAADAEFSGIGAATARPSTALPLVLDETVLYRAYARQTDYDMLADSSGGTWTLAGASDRALLAYHFDASMLGGARYELAHLADVAVQHALSRSYGLAASYQFAARDYAQDAYSGYSGMYHAAAAELTWGSPRATSEGSTGYVFERDNTSDGTLRSTGHGARVQLHARLGGGADLRVSALAVQRTFDAAAMGRVDTHVRTEAALYLDATASVGVLIGGSFVRNASNAADFDYTKWTAFVGLVAAAAPR
jgi:hypothetical protein